MNRSIEHDRVARLRELARRQRTNPTPAEQAFWELVRKRRFHGYVFRRQAVLDPYVVDFYCSELGLVVELHGEVHARQRDQDERRAAALEWIHGVRVFRFSNHRVRDSPGVIWSILERAFGLEG